MNPVFGKKEDGVEYVDRPAAYVVIRGEGGRVAAVRGRLGYFLPGGGTDPGESPAETVIREVREELAHEITLGETIGTATQYFTVGEKSYRLLATFFKGSLASPTNTVPEYEIEWLHPLSEGDRFFHECHAWAARSSVKIGSYPADGESDARGLCQAPVVMVGASLYISPAVITTYAEFWDFYIREHSRPATRWLHFAGTTLGIALLIFFIAIGRWYFFPLFLVVGYAFAWFAHFVVEKNRPATFKYPFWSFISDFRMMWFMITGRMESEVARVIKSS